MIPDTGLSKRTFLKVAGMAGLGALTFGTTACDKKDIDFYIATVTNSLEQLKKFLPAQEQLLTKAITIAKSINQAYQDGKFDTAMSLADSLVGVIDDIIVNSGINLSDTAQMILSIAEVALTTAAVLIKNAKPTTATNRSLSPAEARIESLASPKRVNAIFEAARVRR